MKINIYYGGRGLIEDSTLYVIQKITNVLEELRVSVKCYKLYESKNEIMTLPSTIKEADGIILAASIEWFGIGGYMQQFLDACWQYGDKSKIAKTFMMPVVISRTFGEKEAELALVKAWELLGGRVCSGISAYVQSQTDFETNAQYVKIFEDKAEMLYRTVNQRAVSLPTSNGVLKQGVGCSSSVDLTPQESEELSKYVSNDTYVRKQKEDIKELSDFFKGMLESGEKDTEPEFVRAFRENFNPIGDDFAAVYQFIMTDTQKSLVIDISYNHMKSMYTETDKADVVITTTRAVMNKIVSGRSTFQGAFMSGEIKSKGEFKTYRVLDQLFPFETLM